ncbi:hypothetical protein LCGC14_1615510 [marine sediment metagenome]|uniref:Uncharacterized protein n=1 Tax=marine sediment metagenome TaxID=412755 RepID=A0A0F9L742_9ZZZZ
MGGDLEKLNPESKTTKKLEEFTCESCGEKYQKEIPLVGGKPLWISRECHACAEKREKEEIAAAELALQEARDKTRNNWRHFCGMPDELLLKTFDNYDRTEKSIKSAYRAASEWAKAFSLDTPRGYPSLLLYSEGPGVGKGHLMAAIVNSILNKWAGDPKKKCPLRFESGPSLVKRIKGTYNLRKGDDIHEREDEVYKALSGVALLLLDDIGKEKASDFTRETYWFIIDERVKSSLPVIISTRLEFDSKELENLMGEDTVDRIYGMVRGIQVNIKGASYRRWKGIP